MVLWFFLFLYGHYLMRRPLPEISSTLLIKDDTGEGGTAAPARNTLRSGMIAQHAIYAVVTCNIKDRDVFREEDMEGATYRVEEQMIPTLSVFYLKPLKNDSFQPVSGVSTFL